jgi:alpha-mannosidase
MNPNLITVHMIGNAHLDPVWLWPWQAGLDEVFATAHTMCNLLDDYPDAVFTAGEAWRYDCIAKLEPKLLDRIRGHVDAARWDLVGGWWIQPDCNFPSGFALREQIRTGKEVFLARFGHFPEVAYNVDSFGHDVALPRLLREAGQKYYVMMRPNRWERSLPARLFRWKSCADGPAVLTFRIADCYSIRMAALEDGSAIRNALDALPNGIRHTMCFYGVGDHGGGPTVEMIEWIRNNRDRFDGARLEFSSPQRFFAAVSEQAELCPEVVGELQRHAVGCYSVVRDIKTRVRAAEHRLDQAQRLEPEADLKESWRTVAFNQFHDILGGTCLPSANQQQINQLGGVLALGDKICQFHLRKRLIELPDDPRQRIVLFNPNEAPFDGYVECEPWVHPEQWKPGCCLLDAAGNSLPYQPVLPEQVNKGQAFRLLFRARLAAGELTTVRLDPMPASTDQPLAEDTDRAVNAEGYGFSLERIPIVHLAGIALNVSLVIDEDPTDNWSHNIDRFAEIQPKTPAWDWPKVLENGPLLAARIQRGTYGRSEYSWEWRAYRNSEFVEMILRMHWCEKRRLAKLVVHLPDRPVDRLDGTMDGHLLRINDGCERPMRDWTRTATTAILSPDAYALDATPERIRLTLVRSPILTQHDPAEIRFDRAVYADQGTHVFRFRFYGKDTATETLDREALHLHRPIMTADWTRGMPR